MLFGIGAPVRYITQGALISIRNFLKERTKPTWFGFDSIKFSPYFTCQTLYI